MKYRVGQKVVYIGPDFRGSPMAAFLKVTPPVPNAVYTIRGGKIVICGPFLGKGYVFEEIINPEISCCNGGTCEVHTNEEWLRPLTDISLFERLRKEVEAGGDIQLVRDGVDA